MIESKFLINVHLVLCPTTLGVPAVGHIVRGDANSQQYWPVGSGPDVAAHGVRNS
jgi:hypothetical protein